MVALWIILGILAAIALILGIILALPVDVLFLLDEENGFRILYRFLGKRYGEERNPNNPIVKGLKRVLGLSHLDSVKTIRSTVENHGAAVTLKETLATLWDLIERILWILQYCSISKCRIISICGGEDAPLDYGTSCAVIYPLVSYFESVARLRPRNKEVRIQCDYDRPEGSLELEIAVRVHILHVLRALLHIIKKNVEKELLSAEAEG